MITKVIEMIASSDKSFNDFTRDAMKEVSKTVKNIHSVYLKEINSSVEDN